MSRTNPLMIEGEPTLTLLANFWANVRDDLRGHGITLDNTPGSRVLPYAERIAAERSKLREDAILFLDTPEFRWWAQLSELNPSTLREALLASH